MYIYETSMPQNFYLLLQNNKMNGENEMKRKTRQPGFHDETSWYCYERIYVVRTYKEYTLKRLRHFKDTYEWAYKHIKW